MRHSLSVLPVLASIFLTGCGGVAAVRPFDSAGQVWPPPPETARIQFVTEFQGPSDLGIRNSFWGRFLGVTAGSTENSMLRPMAVAATADGQVVFVADPDARCIHRFDLRSERYDCLLLDSGAVLVSPVGLAIDSDGQLFVADSALDLVLVADAQDNALRVLNLSPPPVQPTGLAVNLSGDLFVTSTASHSVRRYGSAGRLIREYGGRGAGPGQMNYPTYLWLTPPSELLVTDTMNFRIQRIDVENGALSVFGDAGDSTGSLARPKGVAMDRHGHIYVLDSGHHALQIFNRDGQLLLAVGEQGQGEGQFWLPSGIFVTAEGLIFVADAYNQRVQVFRYLGDDS